MKTTVVRMTLLEDSPVKFGGKFDVLYCPWEDMSRYVVELLEQDAGKATISFDVFEIDGSFAGWLSEDWLDGVDLDYAPEPGDVAGAGTIAGARWQSR
jgi:hypothetical protein